MSAIEVLVVGPAGGATGGVNRFFTEQCERLPGEFDVRPYDAGSPPDDDGGGTFAKLYASLLAMVAFPLAGRPDVVHVHTSHRRAFYRATWYVLVAGVVWRRPVVVHVHGSSFDSFLEATTPVAVLTQRLTFRVADRVIALSAGWRDLLAERVDESKVVVVPNAVDPGEYDPVYGVDPPVVTFVSNHIRRKGIREFVEAVERLEGTGVRVRVAGTGSLSSLVTDLAASRSYVEYLGYVSEVEKRRLLDESSAYVLPTYAEGLPIALLEGMAGGNAVVTTDVGAIPEVLDEGSGWVVPPGDADALAEALLEFAADPDAAVGMGRHNRAIVEERYAWPVVVDRLTEIYRSLSDAGRSPDGPPTADPGGAKAG